MQEIVPVISIMCNPGVRERHWSKMSDIAGFDLTPDTGSTLRKVLKLNLDPYMDQFEQISGAASKVSRPELILSFSSASRLVTLSMKGNVVFVLACR